MRKPVAATFAADKPSPPRIGLAEAPAFWVCFALLFALVVLAVRIASML